MDAALDPLRDRRARVLGSLRAGHGRRAGELPRQGHRRLAGVPVRGHRLLPGGGAGAPLHPLVEGQPFRVLGVLGAVCIIWAFQNGGTPIRVMPLVFAGAPVVTAIINLAKNPEGIGALDPRLLIGLLLASVGTWLVLSYAPH